MDCRRHGSCDGCTGGSLSTSPEGRAAGFGVCLLKGVAVPRPWSSYYEYFRTFHSCPDEKTVFN
ncbi:MAG: hypothetical protein IKB22_01535 [Lentisphaeria bacterium]|nr:hypothetical protein [Lentisphaeria bacterium]